MTVTPEEVAVELGREAPALESPTWAQWAQWIEGAYLLIQARLDLEDVDPNLLSYVVRNAVANHVRAWRPDMADRYQVGVDDGLESRSYQKHATLVEISPELWDLLQPVAQAFSTRLVGEPDCGPRYFP